MYGVCYIAQHVKTTIINMIQVHLSSYCALLAIHNLNREHYLTLLCPMSGYFHMIEYQYKLTFIKTTNYLLLLSL